MNLVHKIINILNSSFNNSSGHGSFDSYLKYYYPTRPTYMQQQELVVLISNEQYEQAKKK